MDTESIEMNEEMTIGRLASAAGVNVETVRFYQRSGLLEEPKRPASGYRTYPAAAGRRIRFIKRAQLLGFSLDEIAMLLLLEGSQACTETRELAARKLQMVEAKLADLLAMKSALAGMIERCSSIDGSKVGCPIIQAFVDD